MFERGKIILVPFPFTDLSATKIRPALIISNPKYSDVDVCVVFITSRTGGSKSRTEHVMLSSQRDFKQTGLKSDSVVRCGKIATLDKKIVLGEIGSIGSADQTKIDQMIRLALGL